VVVALAARGRRRVTPFDVPAGVRGVRLEAELRSVCPFNGHADTSTIEVLIEPAGRSVEIESFRAYLAQYAEQPISHEHIAVRICDDVATAVAPKRVEVRDTFVRDGLTLAVRAEWP
jgi:NADPH-dependent 7-cyano-7-deazaguanine reductase QueF